VQVGKITMDQSSWHAKLYREAYIQNRAAWLGISFSDRQNLINQNVDNQGYKELCAENEKEHAQMEGLSGEVLWKAQRIADSNWRKGFSAWLSPLVESFQARKGEELRERFEAGQISLCPYFHSVWFALLFYRVKPAIGRWWKAHAGKIFGTMIALFAIGATALIVRYIHADHEEKISQMRSWNPTLTTGQLEVKLEKIETRREKAAEEKIVQDAKWQQERELRQKRYDREQEQAQRQKKREQKRADARNSYNFKKAHAEYLQKHGYDPEALFAWLKGFVERNGYFEGRVTVRSNIYYYNLSSLEHNWSTRFKYLSHKYTDEEAIALIHQDKIFRSLDSSVSFRENMIIAAQVVKYLALSIFAYIFLFLGFFPWMSETGLKLMWQKWTQAWNHMVMDQHHTRRGQIEKAVVAWMFYILSRATAVCVISYAVIFSCEFVFDNFQEIVDSTISLVVSVVDIAGAWIFWTGILIGAVVLLGILLPKEGEQQVSTQWDITPSWFDIILMFTGITPVLMFVGWMLGLIADALVLMFHFGKALYRGICPNIHFTNRNASPA
jgi:hypothetical protein